MATRGQLVSRSADAIACRRREGTTRLEPLRCPQSTSLLLVSCKSLASTDSARGPGAPKSLGHGRERPRPIAACVWRALARETRSRSANVVPDPPRGGADRPARLTADQLDYLEAKWLAGTRPSGTRPTLRPRVASPNSSKVTPVPPTRLAKSGRSGANRPDLVGGRCAGISKRTAQSMTWARERWPATHGISTTTICRTSLVPFSHQLGGGSRTGVRRGSHLMVGAIQKDLSANENLGRRAANSTVGAVTCVHR